MCPVWCSLVQKIHGNAGACHKTRKRRGKGTGFFSLRKQREKKIKLLSTAMCGGDYRGNADRLISTQ